MAYDFRWNDWNVHHIADHNIIADEAEYVVNHAAPPYPEHRADEKWLVIGQTQAGEYIQVIFVIDLDRTLFVIHARALSDREKRRYRRRRR